MTTIVADNKMIVHDDFLVSKINTRPFLNSKIGQSKINGDSQLLGGSYHLEGHESKALRSWSSGSLD